MPVPAEECEFRFSTSVSGEQLVVGSEHVPVSRDTPWAREYEDGTYRIDVSCVASVGQGTRGATMEVLNRTLALLKKEIKAEASKVKAAYGV